MSRRWLAVGLAAAGVILLPPLLAQTIPGTEPIPAEQLRGRTFLGPGSSFSVDAPSEEWQWLHFVQAEKAASAMHADVDSSMYLLFHAKTRTAYVFSVLSGPRSGAPNEQFMRGVRSGIERTSPTTGWAIQDFAFEPSDIPVKEPPTAITQRQFGQMEQQSTDLAMSVA